MLFRIIIAWVWLAFGISIAAAQQYPTHVVKIVIPYAPGGGIDVFVRALAANLTTKWGQPVVVENHAGAGGNIGAAVAAQSPADGYTLLGSVNATFTANPYLYKSLTYDPDHDFVPITLMVQNDQFLLANPSVPATNLRELVAYAHREPGKLNYGAYGKGTQPQLIYEILNKKEGLDLLHVPYKGIAPILTAVMGGEVMLTAGSSAVAGGFLKAGMMKALARTGKSRTPEFPDVATTAEEGYPYVQASIWYGLFAPAQTPPAIVDKIGADVRAIVKTPAFAQQYATSQGLQLVASTSKEFAATISEEKVWMGEMIRAAGIQPE